MAEDLPSVYKALHLSLAYRYTEGREGGREGRGGEEGGRKWWGIPVIPSFGRLK